MYLACDGKSINFSIGSTPHPVLHAVLASVCVSAFRCLTSFVSIPFSTILELSESDAQNIEAIYKKIFVPLTEFDVRIQEYCRRLTVTDAFEDLTLYVPLSGSHTQSHFDIFDLNDMVQRFQDSEKMVGK